MIESAVIYTVDMERDSAGRGFICSGRVQE